MGGGISGVQSGKSRIFELLPGQTGLVQNRIECTAALARQPALVSRSL